MGNSCKLFQVAAKQNPGVKTFYAIGEQKVGFPEIPARSFWQNYNWLFLT